MKLQINTDLKTITIEEDVSLKYFIDMLGNMFPNRSWEAFTLKTNIITNYNNPFVVYPYVPDYPLYPWVTFEQSTGGNSSNIDLQYSYATNPQLKWDTGTYNIELK